MIGRYLGNKRYIFKYKLTIKYKKDRTDWYDQIKIDRWIDWTITVEIEWFSEIVEIR